MKIFNHINNNPILAELPKEEIDGKRFYITPSGKKLPSVTTFLSSFEKPALKKWQQRVGIAEANRVRNYSTNRGKAFHSLMEWYLGNNYDKDWLLQNTMPDLRDSFYKMVPILDSIDNIHYIETMLYSEAIGLAGQVDLIASFDGVPSIIDFKTAARPKTEDWIEDYFLQTTAYSLMYEDMTAIKAKRLVILISVENDYPQVFVKERKDYVEPLYEKIKAFRNQN